MIRMNLIESANRANSFGSSAPVNFASVDVTSRRSKQRVALSIVLVVVLGFVGMISFFVVAGLPKPLEGVIPVPILSALGVEDPSREGLSTDFAAARTTSAGGSIESQHAADAAAALLAAARSQIPLERVASDVRPEQFIKESKRDGYASFLPLEQVAYQKAMASQILVFINAVTPDNVSFADLIYQAPNFYYIHGVAENPLLQRGYLERLRLASAKFKTPPLPENAPATDITAYGEMTAPRLDPNTVAKSFVKEADVALEVNALRALDISGKVNLVGFDHPSVEDFGVYKRYTYRVTSNADFQVMLHFMDAYQKSPVRIGVQKMEMRAANKDALATTMKLVMYVTR